jgi:AraC-like DNA-binding protein
MSPLIERNSHDDMPIGSLEYRPHEGARPYVEFYWRGTFAPGEEGLLSQRVVPNGYVELIIHLGDASCHLYRNGQWSSSATSILIGLYSEPYEVRFLNDVQVFGIRFKPEAWLPVLGIPASELCNGHEDLSMVMGVAHEDLVEHVREAADIAGMIDHADTWILRRTMDKPYRRDHVHQAAELIRRAPTTLKIEELAGLVNIGQRQLERSFKQRIGVTPKQYQRMQRLNRVNRLLLHGLRMDLTEIAYACGFADQSHFIREFRLFTGERPNRFLRERDNYLVNVDTAYEDDLPHEPL